MVGIYNPWIDKSLEKLATLLPARYAKPEVSSEFVETMVPGKIKELSEMPALEQAMN